MFRSYFTTGVRNLTRQKGYSLIKIAGLALAASLNKNHDRIARLMALKAALTNPVESLRID